MRARLVVALLTAGTLAGCGTTKAKHPPTSHPAASVAAGPAPAPGLAIRTDGAGGPALALSTGIELLDDVGARSQAGFEVAADGAGGAFAALATGAFIGADASCPSESPISTRVVHVAVRPARTLFRTTIPGILKNAPYRQDVNHLRTAVAGPDATRFAPTHRGQLLDFVDDLRLRPDGSVRLLGVRTPGKHHEIVLATR